MHSPPAPATQIALEPKLREAAEHGGIALITRPKGSRRRGKVWKRDSFGLGALQPIEIPQNRQSFVWKSLEKNDRDLEKLGEMQGGPPLFRHLRRLSGERRDCRC